MRLSHGTHEKPEVFSDRGLLRKLPARLAASVALDERVRTWAGGNEVWFGGVRDAVRALAAAMLANQVRPTSLLVIVPDPVDADIVATDLSAFGFDDAKVLPLSSGIEDSKSLRDHDFAARMQVLQSFRRQGISERSDRLDRSHEYQPLIVCSSIAAAIQSVPSLATVTGSSRVLAVGDHVDLAQLQLWLAEAGFQATTSVQMAGEFCQRGGILDVFAPDKPEPVRFEFFDHEIESIRHFDPASQRSTQKQTSIELSAIGVGTAEDGSLAEYLADDSVVFIVEPSRCKKAAESLRSRVSDPERFATWENLVLQFGNHRLALATDLPETDTASVIQLPTVTVDSFTGELDQIRQRVDTVAAGHRVVVVADTPADAERMGELMRETQAASHGRLSIAVADLSGGFRIAESPGTWTQAVAPSHHKDGDQDDVSSGVLVLTGAELFHRSPVRRTRQRAKSKPIDNVLQLAVGDLVVHLSHGIGLYRGIERMERNGQPQEH